MYKVMIPLIAAGLLAMSGSALAGSVITNDMGKCSAGIGPAIQVNVRGIKSASGKIRVQNYPATQSAWLAKGPNTTRLD